MSNILRAALLEIDRDITYKEIREIIILQIFLLGIYLIIYSRNSITNLISKLLESTTILNLKRLLKRILQLLKEGNKYIIKRICKANIRLSTKFLRPI